VCSELSDKQNSGHWGIYESSLRIVVSKDTWQPRNKDTSIWPFSVDEIVAGFALVYHRLYIEFANVFDHRYNTDIPKARHNADRGLPLVPFFDLNDA